VLSLVRSLPKPRVAVFSVADVKISSEIVVAEVKFGSERGRPRPDRQDLQQGKIGHEAHATHGFLSEAADARFKRRVS